MVGDRHTKPSEVAACFVGQASLRVTVLPKLGLSVCLTVTVLLAHVAALSCVSRRHAVP